MFICRHTELPQNEPISLAPAAAGGGRGWGGGSLDVGRVVLLFFYSCDSRP